MFEHRQVNSREETNYKGDWRIRRIGGFEDWTLEDSDQWYDHIMNLDLTTNGRGSDGPTVRPTFARASKNPNLTSRKTKQKEQLARFWKKRVIAWLVRSMPPNIATWKCTEW